eukprot:3805991-Pyramimonas_sp.AAC.1
MSVSWLMVLATYQDGKLPGVLEETMYFHRPVIDLSKTSMRLLTHAGLRVYDLSEALPNTLARLASSQCLRA